MKMPSRADVVARRVGQLKDTIRKNIGEGDLDLYLELVEQLAEEGPHDMSEIAAAAVRLASAEKPLAAVVEIREPAPAPFRPSVSTAKVRLQMSIGKRDGVRPADIVGSIANEAGLAGRDIGPIEIRDSSTFVTVPADAAERVIEKVGRAKFKGRPVNLRVAAGGSSAPPRKGPPKRR
ncbi:MAG: DbpA RNA binding domain-containing protein [Thermoanaerobaculia bacterium]